MISVSDALQIIENQANKLAVEHVSFMDALGRILMEEWTCDRDLPPYDRVMMDGIGIDYDSFLAGRRTFDIENVAAAGMPQKALKSPVNCLEVMTGSVLPLSVNTVVRYEDVTIEDGKTTIKIDTIKPFQNIHAKGKDIKKGQIVASPGKIISAAEIGLAASIGKTKIAVSEIPKVLIISTGDELVEVEDIPLDHQIRRSNVFAIQATLLEMGLKSDTAHLLDDREQIKEKLKSYLDSYDVIILSGGVSKGKFDFIPSVMEELGVQKCLHRVAQRPGKPFWFGVKDKCTIFALPGNPISSFVCIEKYFKYWYRKVSGLENHKSAYAILTEDVQFRPDLTYFLEVTLSFSEDGRVLATPQKGNGSGDLANLACIDGFLELPQGPIVYKAGEVFPLLNFRK